MNSSRLAAITSAYPRLKIAIVGDFCLDRYLEIDPAKSEISIETSLPVHNVTRVRSQPGAAGTILNNLVALGIGQIFAVGFAGEDGEGWELRRALQEMDRVRLDHFVSAKDRRTFTYAKPLIIEQGKPPRELNRLDFKNWTPTPRLLAQALADSMAALAGGVDAIILMDQVDLPNTGVVTDHLLGSIARLRQTRPDLLVLADSRRSLRGFSQVIFKMNNAELAALLGAEPAADLRTIQQQALDLARRQGQLVFITLSERGIVGASPSGEAGHVDAFPVLGEIDVVGAGDAVTANLASALAAGATIQESMILAMAAASIVVHQLGTTGTATTPAIQDLLKSSNSCKPNDAGSRVILP